MLETKVFDRASQVSGSRDRLDSQRTDSQPQRVALDNREDSDNQWEAMDNQWEVSEVVVIIHRRVDSLHPMALSRVVVMHLR